MTKKKKPNKSHVKAQYDEKPILFIDTFLRIFVFIAFFVIALYSETIKADDIVNRSIIILVITVAFGSFMKAIHSFYIGIMVGYENEQFAVVISSFKTFVDVTAGAAIIYVLFATYVPYTLGLLLFIITFVFLGLFIYSHVKKQI